MNTQQKLLLPKLFKKTETGATQQWQIIVENDTFYTESGQVDGKITRSKPTKCIGKSVGRSNETSGAEQALLEAQAKWEKKVKANYKEDISRIEEKLFFAPMLAEKYTKYKDKIQFPVCVQDKLNGIRCIISADGAFSRKGEEFYCIDHIKKAVAPLFKQHPNLILDGELYNEQYKNQLNQITSLVSVNRKPKDITPNDIKRSEEIVEYHIYDGLNFYYNNALLRQFIPIYATTPYQTRYIGLQELLKDISTYIKPLGYNKGNSSKDIDIALSVSKKYKREGIIIRLLDGVYENKRSKNLLKYKNSKDEEFEIIDIKQGKGNWIGCAKKITCKLNKVATDGRTEFDSNIKGTQEDLANLWKNKKKYIGKMATVNYQEKSEFGIPLIPYTSLPFRDYE